MLELVDGVDMLYVFVLFLVPLACEGQSVPLYGRYQTCVLADSFKYKNPFNYTEVSYVCMS